MICEKMKSCSVAKGAIVVGYGQNGPVSPKALEGWFRMMR